MSPQELEPGAVWAIVARHSACVCDPAFELPCLVHNKAAAEVWLTALGLACVQRSGDQNWGFLYTFFHQHSYNRLKSLYSIPHVVHFLGERPTGAVIKGWAYTQGGRRGTIRHPTLEDLLLDIGCYQEHT